MDIPWHNSTPTCSSNFANRHFDSVLSLIEKNPILMISSKAQSKIPVIMKHMGSKTTFRSLFYWSKINYSFSYVVSQVRFYSPLFPSLYLLSQTRALFSEREKEARASVSCSVERWEEGDVTDGARKGGLSLGRRGEFVFSSGSYWSATVQTGHDYKVMHDSKWIIPQSIANRWMTQLSLKFLHSMCGYTPCIR